ncbi:MAG: DUF4175 family protein, partial [Parvularculaceae bacterium]|nr:DUF4175 family protein [Parvularculaceae bacterium]
MTDRPPQLKPKISTAHRDGAAHALVLRAKFAIFWERIAPVLLVIGAPAFTIFVISLFDAWRFVPQWVHLAALVAAGAATAYAAVKVRESRFWPTRTQALKRLERDGGVRHDGVQSLEDAPAGGGADNPLWAAHLEQSAARARRARIGRLRETLNARDRFGLRYAALALMLVGIISAGGDFGARIARGLTPGDPRAVMPGFADLWVEPPPYTGKAPVYLLGGDETLAGKRELISLPEGAVAIAQVKSRSGLRFGVKTAAGFTPAEKEGPARSARARLVLHESGVITLRAGGREGRWPVEIIADRPPQAEFSAPPQADDAGRLAVAARFDDDYGVAEASLRLRLVADQDRPLDAPAFDAQTTNASRLIALDGAAGPSGERRFTLDLQ